MNEKTISIIIPCYNCAGTISETIDSLTYNDTSDYEVIAIDDGSTDDTWKELLKIKESFDIDINISTKANEGVSVTRNVGIKQAKGKWIVFLDADDMLSKGFLDKIIFVDSSRNIDVITCYRTSDMNIFLNENRKEIVFRDPLSVLREYTYSKARLGITSFVMKRSLLINNGICFTENAKYGEDFELITKYLAHCKNACITSHYYYYRILEHSASRIISYRQTDMIESARRGAQYLKAINHPFCDEFDAYMENRAIFACAHRFASAKDYECYSELINNYPVKQAMRKLLIFKNTDLKSRIAALLFIINHKLFYFLA